MADKIFNNNNFIFSLSVIISILLTNCSLNKSYLKYSTNDPQLQSKLTSLKDSLKNNPKDKKLNFKIAEIYLSDRDYRASDHFLSKAIEIDTNYYDAYFLRAELYWDLYNECERERQENKISFEDKLFFRLIYENYKISSNSDHLKDQSLRKMENLWSLADFSDAFIGFGQINKVKFSNNCYKWVDPKIKSKNLVYYITENKGFKSK
jgi:tetratricopeptide (TPR) repeat protein